MLENNIEVFIQSVLSTRYEKHIYFVEKLNNKLKLLVNQQKDNGKKIEFIDVNQILVEKNQKLINQKYVLKDGIHLNKEAYDIWYSTIKKYLGNN